VPEFLSRSRSSTVACANFKGLTGLRPSPKPIHLSQFKLAGRTGLPMSSTYATCHYPPWACFLLLHSDHGSFHIFSLSCPGPFVTLFMSQSMKLFFHNFLPSLSFSLHVRRFFSSSSIPVPRTLSAGYFSWYSPARPNLLLFERDFSRLFFFPQRPLKQASRYISISSLAARATVIPTSPFP